MAMIRLPQAIIAVLACTLTAGMAGGIVGAAVGTFAPSFVVWLATTGPAQAPLKIEAAEFGLGLGAVCGLFLGTGAGCFLVAVVALRDAWLARAGLAPGGPKPTWEVDELSPRSSA